MKFYKLTGPAPDYYTYGKTEWGENITHSATGKGQLCSAGWIHAYTDPLLAVMFNKIHGNFAEPLTLWEAEGEVGLTDHGLKVGCQKLTTLRLIPVPAVILINRVAFAIYCALETYHEPSFVAWAENWLDGKNRSAKAAYAAYAAAYAANAAAYAAYAANAAANAAYAAAYAAKAAYAAANAAYAAAYAAKAAYAAAYAAANAADAATLDFIALAQKAMKIE